MTFDESKLPPGWLPGDPVPEPEPTESDAVAAEGAPPQPDGSVQSGWALKLIHELVWGTPHAVTAGDANGLSAGPGAPRQKFLPLPHVWEHDGGTYGSYGAFRSYDEWNEALQREIGHARLPEPPPPTIAPEAVADADDLDISDGGE